jgi:hypothetical protein
VKIPEGWKLVPIEPTEEMLSELIRPKRGGQSVRSQQFSDYKAMLAAASTPPAQEVEPVGYIHRPHGLAYEWRFSDELPVSNWIKVHQVWQFVYAAPQDDSLRRAAEEALKFLSEPEKMNKLGDYITRMCIARDSLRAALEEK